MELIRIEKVCIINDNKIIIDIDFFNRLLIKASMKNNKSLSGVSLRLALVLLQTLNEYYPTEIPPRNDLANLLGVSRTAIINGLSQLEEDGFLIREVSMLQNIIYADENKQSEMNEYWRMRKNEEKIRRDYSGKFLINTYYNSRDIAENASNSLDFINKNYNQEKYSDLIYKKQNEERFELLEKRIEELEAMNK